MIEDFIFDYFGWIISAVAVALIGLLVWAVKMDGAEDARLMSQCLADGKKEYECVSLLRRPASQVVPMPIIIPMR